MSDKPGSSSVTIPADDLNRSLTVARPEDDHALAHVSVAGDTYTILITGEQTAGRCCLIDMLVPPGGGPPPHRHDFEEMFTILDGEIEFTFRGEKSVVRAGQTINIPANAPHLFKNVSNSTARLLCYCSPSGQEKMFIEVGDPVPTRTSPPPKLSEAEQKARRMKAETVAAKYKTELLGP
jgi:quercetin dioxygenase-like cupin family protein